MKKTTKGKYYKIGNKHAIFADKDYKIETNKEVTELATLKELPVEMQEKCKSKDKDPKNKNKKVK